jgi:hypothetical protein
MSRTMLMMVAVVAVLAGQASALCTGDCGGDGQVTVDELVLSVNIALGTGSLAQCTSADGNGDSQVTVDELVSAVNNALVGCPTFAGEYYGIVDFPEGGSANMNLTVEADGRATGEVVIYLGSAGLIGRAAELLTRGTTQVESLVITGSVDLDTGEYMLSGSYLQNGETVPVAASGVLPQRPGTTGTFNFRLGTSTYAGSIVTGDGSTPTPTRTVPVPTATPTQAGPTPTPPTGGCADGIFEVTASNLSADSNLAVPAVTLGKVTAVDTLDTTGNTYVWTVTAAPCSVALGDISHVLVLQAVGIPTRIQPGTYPLASATPPFVGITYSESRLNPLDPGGNFSRSWGTTGGTLIIEDAGGGVLRVRASGVPMGPHPFLRGGTGTFTLELNGVITRVMR